MNILVIYETYSSSTETVSQLVTDFFEAKKHSVTVKKALEADPQSFSQFDLILLASPSWWVDEKDGQPHINFKTLFEKTIDNYFVGKNCAVIGLGDSTYAHFCGAVEHLEKYITDHGGNLIADSLRIDSFYFDRQNNEKLLYSWLEKLA